DAGTPTADATPAKDATQSPDTSAPDTSAPDTSTPDTSTPDTSMPDAGADVTTDDADAAPPTYPTSCKAILAASPQSTSGVYTIDPDGNAGPAPALPVYCDMDFAGGGWTLIMA